MFNISPIFLTSVKATDRQGNEVKINVEAQKVGGVFIVHFWHPRKYSITLALSKDQSIRLTDGHCISPDEVEKLNKFCTL